MKQGPVISDRKVRFGALALTLFWPLLGGCQSREAQRRLRATDVSVVLAGPAMSPNVENGQAFDKATLVTDEFNGVVVPDDARIERGGEKGRIEIFMKKEMGFQGHPTSLMSIHDTRKMMGCASKTEGEKVVIATYGEYTTIEGGRGMTVLIRVPADLPVESRKGLSGVIGVGLTRKYMKPREEVKPGEGGWNAIPDEPDPEHTAP